MNNKIKIISPRSEVEVQLPDGLVLSGPRGMQVGEFLAALEYESQLVAAIVNYDLRELTYPINIESQVQPILAESPDGARIYRRSLTFLLEMAFADLFPAATLFVDHSVASGGYYCQVKGRETFSEAEVAALKAHMQELIEANLPFEKSEVPLQEAIEYFRVRGDDDKVSLLKYRKKDYLTLYRLGERRDYLHGYMVPSTGYLRLFDLVVTPGGFILQFPRRHNPNHLIPLPEYPKLLSAFCNMVNG